MLWCLHDTFCCCFSLSFFLATCFSCLSSNEQQQQAYHMLQFPSYKWWLQLWVRFYPFFFFLQFVLNVIHIQYTYRLEATKKKVQRKKILNNFLFCWWFSFRQFVGCLHNFFVIFFNFLINIMLFIITLVRFPLHHMTFCSHFWNVGFILLSIICWHNIQICRSFHAIFLFICRRRIIINCD